MGVLNLKITSRRPSSYFTSNFQRVGSPKSVASSLAAYIESLSTGTELAQGAGQPPSIVISVQGNETSASATVTFSDVATIGDTVIINGVTFTAAAAAAANVFAIGATATASAAGLAAAINASVTALVSGYVTATSALGVTTVTSALPGTAGNQTTIAEGVDDGGVIAVSSARLVGGAVDASALTLNF
jgi:hypothetical protein